MLFRKQDSDLGCAGLDLVTLICSRRDQVAVKRDMDRFCFVLEIKEYSHII